MQRLVVPDNISVTHLIHKLGDAFHFLKNYFLLQFAFAIILCA